MIDAGRKRVVAPPGKERGAYLPFGRRKNSGNLEKSAITGENISEEREKERVGSTLRKRGKKRKGREKQRPVTGSPFSKDVKGDLMTKKKKRKKKKKEKKRGEGRL